MSRRTLRYFKTLIADFKLQENGDVCRDGTSGNKIDCFTSRDFYRSLIVSSLIRRVAHLQRGVQSCAWLLLPLKCAGSGLLQWKHSRRGALGGGRLLRTLRVDQCAFHHSGSAESCLTFFRDLHQSHISSSSARYANRPLNSHRHHLFPLLTPWLSRSPAFILPRALSQISKMKFCIRNAAMEVLSEGKNFRLVQEEELPEILDFLAQFLPDSIKVCTSHVYLPLLPSAPKKSIVANLRSMTKESISFCFLCFFCMSFLCLIFKSMLLLIYTFSC